MLPLAEWNHQAHRRARGPRRRWPHRPPLVTHIRRKNPPQFPAILGVLAVASAVLGFIVLTH